MKALDDRTPIIVGVGETVDRTKDLESALEPIDLMAGAVRAAQEDAGGASLGAVDSLDVVCEHSWPYVDAPGLLAGRLGCTPTRRIYGEPGGESPVRLIHEAALRIARGESQLAVVTGAEARYSVEAASRSGISLPWSPRDAIARLTRGEDICHPAARALGAVSPVNVYPLYENATAAHWGMTPRQAMEESAQLWSRYSQIAASNPNSWSRQAFTAEEVRTIDANNRLIAWPYTKRMVANPLVNMGAAVILTSVGHARTAGIEQVRWIYVWSGAAAQEPRDYLQRSQYFRSHAQDVVMEAVVDEVGGNSAAFEMLELYSCFPVVPKMARRTLGLPSDAPMTSTGGLSFFGAPLHNYMTHAAVGLARALRRAPGKVALLYGQGEFVTKHHALILGSAPPPKGLLRSDYSVQVAADARRGAVPPLLLTWEGTASLETFTVAYSRDGSPSHGIVIARTPKGERLIARVDAGDAVSLRVLTDMNRSPVGVIGVVTSGSSGVLTWSV